KTGPALWLLEKNIMKIHKLSLLGQGVNLLTIISISLLGTAASVRAASPDESPGQLSKSDYKFAAEAATGGKMEVTLGTLAAEKGTSPAVKQFGEQMATDHGKAAERLKQIALAQGATL